MPENLGPAGAGAYAVRELAAAGFDWILFGDDDDPPVFDYAIERLLRLVNARSAEKLGVVGAVGARFDWRKGEADRLRDEELTGVVPVDTIGTGHQLMVSRAAVEEAGLPDARLFFGGYDPEYCLRIGRAGYRLLVDGELMRKLRENAGRLGRVSTKSLVSTYAYESLWRRYYRTRNYIFTMRETFRRPDLARREAVKAAGRIAWASARGPRYGARFAYLQTLGVIDGYRGRMGRTVAPALKTSSERDR
jgi:hypothetical protein